MLSATSAWAQHRVVESKAYYWHHPVEKTNFRLFQDALFEGTGAEMSWMMMSVNALWPSDTAQSPITTEIPADSETILIVRSGRLGITMDKATSTLGKGSAVLLLPKQRVTIENVGKDSCTFYTLEYTSVHPVNMTRGDKAGGALVKDWNTIAFKPHDKGGIRNYFERPTAMCQRLEMHVTTLNEGLKSHEPHKHTAEEIVVVIDNETEMQIGDHVYKGGPGTVYYLGTNVSHAIRNVGKGSCTYFAFQFE